MIEQIIDGIWEDLRKSLLDDDYNADDDEVKHRWRIIIRKAIAESQKEDFFDSLLQPSPLKQVEDTTTSDAIIYKSSQAMLEETAVMDR